jgi:hypothetical protein
MASSRAWTFLGLFLVGACGEGVTCPQGVFAAVSVHALTALNGTPILNAHGGVRDGGYADSLVELGQGYYDAAMGRPGTYAVHLEHADYAPWDTTGVVVRATSGPCPVIETEQLEARLVPTE